MRFAIQVATLLGILATVPGPAGASQFPPMSLQGLYAGSELAVVAHVESVRPVWEQTPQGDRVIVSKVLLRIEEALKGQSPQTQWIDVVGGTLDGVTLHVSSLPEMKVGDRAVFFLHRKAQGAFEPHQKGQGILFLENETVRGSKVTLDQVRAARGNN